MKKDIHIGRDGTADDCHLQASADEANWINNGDVVRKIVFTNGSPFAQSEYEVSAHGSKGSGPVTTNEKRRFDYTTPEPTANEPAADPGIIIH